MRYFDLEVVRADIIVSRVIFFQFRCSVDKMPLLMNMAAYHAGQAIEKCLKIIIKDNRPDLFSEISDTHNIESLVVKAELCKAGFVSEHPFIGENASELSMLNNLRYCKASIDVQSTNLVVDAAKDLYREIEKEFIKQHTRRGESEKDVRKKNQDFSKRDLESKNKISFKPAPSRNKKAASRKKKAERDDL